MNNIKFPHSSQMKVQLPGISRQFIDKVQLFPNGKSSKIR